MTNKYSKYRFFALVFLMLALPSVLCFSKQKKHHKKTQTKTPLVDTAKGITEEQKKIMIQNILEEKLHKHYLDTAKNKKQ